MSRRNFNCWVFAFNLISFHRLVIVIEITTCSETVFRIGLRPFFVRWSPVYNTSTLYFLWTFSEQLGRPLVFEFRFILVPNFFFFHLIINIKIQTFYLYIQATLH